MSVQEFIEKNLNGNPNEAEKVLISINKTVIKPNHMTFKLSKFTKQPFITAVYGQKTEFREIVFSFKSNGSMTSKLLMNIYAKSVADLRSKQTPQLQ